MCIYLQMNYIFICPDSQQREVFGNAVVLLIHSHVCCGLVHWICSASRERRIASRWANLSFAGWNQWHYSTEWKLRFIKKVTICYALCLTKSQKNTAIVVRAPQCATEVCVICVHLKYEVEAGPDSIPDPDRTLRSAALTDTTTPYQKKLKSFVS